jgi:putative transposase
MFGFGLQSIEPIDMMIVLGIRISFERTMLVAERFIQKLATDMANILYVLMVAVLGIHPQACKFLRFDHHHLHSSFEKSVIERTIRYIKDRTETFEDYFPCRKISID